MSTLKVDTYLTRGGASEIAIDKLKGVTAAGSIVITDTNGNVTTNIQQGLAKFWLSANGAASLDESFNIASGTDNGTGDYTYAITNDMSSIKYSPGANDNTSGNNLLNVFATAAATIRVNSHVADSGTAADNNNLVQGHGDLA